MKIFASILLFLFINGFFGAFNLPFSIGYFVVLIIILVCRKSAKKTIFSNPIIFLFIGLAFSMVSCLYFRHQTIIQSLPGYFSYVGIVYYLYLFRSKLSLFDTERMLFILVAVFDVIYILQYILLPYGVNFLNLETWQYEDVNEDAGGIRIRVVSSALYSLGMFYGIVKWLFNRKKKYMILFVLGIIIMLLSGYRQLILSFGIALFYMYFVLRKHQKNFNVWPMVIIALSLYAITFIPDVQEKINGMIYRANTGAMFDNDDYIRVAQYEFYTNDMFVNNTERFLGFGIPSALSSFGKYYSSLQEMGLVYVDWGIIGISWSLGIITAFSMLWFSIKAIRRKVSFHYSYVSIWYVYLLSASITNWEFFRNGNFLVHGLALYIVCIASQKYNEKNCILSK